MLKAFSFSTLLLCKFEPLIVNPGCKQSCCIMSLPCAVVCMLMISVFKRWHVLPHPTGSQQPCLYGNIPFGTTVIVSQPAFLSILRTIEIVIDLPCLDPVAIRSYSQSYPIGKANTAGATGQSARCLDVQLAPCVFCSPPP